MDPKTTAVAQALKALSNPIRIRIVHMIAKGDICQCKLGDEIGEHAVTISRHMATLVKAGLVTIERRGNMNFPHLAHPDIRKILLKTEDVVAKMAQMSLDKAKSIVDEG